MQMTQQRYLARMADNRRRMKDFGYRWLAISGSVRPGHRRVNWPQYRRALPVMFLVSLVLLAGWVVS